METLRLVNKRAAFEYHFLDKYSAGISLTGTEVKSIRDSKVSLAEAFCVFIQSELFIKNMNIAEYSHGNIYNHDPKRLRKLLLRKKELAKLFSKSKEKGLTIIPTELYINERGFVKIDIVLAKGKKLYDKRESIKQKDEARRRRTEE